MTIHGSNKLQVINTTQWLHDNQDKFKPPVCNKLMHNSQLIVMFVGGPNSREDYHIEEGEELFYQVKGEMCVKIIENGKCRDVIIKEGEMFLLPARVPHSPQRKADTIGLVIERRRGNDELDGVRWHVPNSSQPLYEKWFYCTDLGVQLAPVIKEYFASDEYKTKIPKDHVMDAKSLPFKLNNAVLSNEQHGAFNLDERLSKTVKSVLLTPNELKMQFNVEALAEGEYVFENFNEKNVDIWLWQLNGTSKVQVVDENQDEYNLTDKDSLLITENYCNTIRINVASGHLLKVSQDAKLKNLIE